MIALDVGGTVMKGALVGRDHTPVHRARRPTASGGGAAAVAGVLDFAAELLRAGRAAFGAPPRAAGVALPGLVDEAAGVAVYSANLGWREVPLRERLRERLGGLPVALGHDVRAGGLAEGRLGAGTGVDRFLFLALGTGIAGAIGIDGRMEPGAHGGAGEIGHLVVRPGGAPCACGQRGCLETLASASAVARAWGGSAADAARAVAAGDPRARAIWAEAVDALADGLCAAIGLLDPRTVIVGGGLAESGETLLAPLRRALAAKLTFQRMPGIVPAALGDGAGCLGAGLLAWAVAEDAGPAARTAAQDGTEGRTAVPSTARTAEVGQ